MARIFLLSPANLAGRRAEILLRAGAAFELARRLRSPGGAPLGEVFSFVSGLYFRGKLAYARAFASPPDPSCPLTGEGIFVITPGAGLQSPSRPVTLPDLRAFARIRVDPAERRYREPLLTAARSVARRIDGACEIVLLGSVASPKYVELLSGVFGHT